MDADAIIIGVISLLNGLLGFAADKPVTAKQIKEWGSAEATEKVSRWGLVVVGATLIIYGLAAS